MDQINAAHNLKGRILTTGWEVIEKIDRTASATGAFFSVCYKAKKNNEICFLKAFDFAKFFKMTKQSKPAVDVTEIMADMLNAFNYEKQLSNLCRNHHVTKVTFVKDSGQEIVEGYPIAVVPYLIFDLADGDVRSMIDFSKKLDFAWRLKSLHEISVGLKQLHTIEVSHQDLKPSNILVFKDESKLGDLGRSICKSLKSPFDNSVFTGDFNYAPPEIMYDYYVEDWHERVFAADCYLLGSMVVFYFAGISMSALLKKYMPDNFWWDKWRGSYRDVKPYILDAFAQALSEFEESIEDEYFRKELRGVVEMLCYPLPNERGHPKNIQSMGSSYCLERFISKFYLLHRKAKFDLHKWLISSN